MRAGKGYRRIHAHDRFAAGGVGAAAVIGSGFFAVTAFAEAKVDYKKVSEAIKKILDEDNYDDGSIGPVLVRLAWHASGTYDITTKTGGSDGATMRFTPEAAFGANAGNPKSWWLRCGDHDVATMMMHHGRIMAVSGRHSCVHTYA
jgi:hypothetical protein